MNLRAAVLGVIAGAIGATLTFGNAAFGLVDSLFSSPEAEIEAPASTTAPMSFDLSGTFEDVSDSELLWAVTRAHSTNRWHPQDKPCAKLNERRFSCGRYHLGKQDESDKGAAFDIVIVRAGTNAVNEFLRYDKEEANKDPRNPYPGLATLPFGAQILDLKTIVRE